MPEENKAMPILMHKTRIAECATGWWAAHGSPALYQETGDIYLVADVLGHKDVNTTRKHYAALEDSRRRMAAKAVQLREKPTN